jgi:hypothetical protein
MKFFSRSNVFSGEFIVIKRLPQAAKLMAIKQHLTVLINFALLRCSILKFKQG